MATVFFIFAEWKRLCKRKYLKSYIQDGICDTWQVLANMVYPGGLNQLMKIAKNGYGEIGKAKGEWADKIGEKLNLKERINPSSHDEKYDRYEIYNFIRRCEND